MHLLKPSPDNNKKNLLVKKKADPGNSSNLGVASAINHAISSNMTKPNVFGLIRRPIGSTSNSEMEGTDTDTDT